VNREREGVLKGVFPCGRDGRAELCKGWRSAANVFAVAELCRLDLPRACS
jgi:hypothetical protein